MLAKTIEEADYIIFCAGIRHEVVQGIRNMYEVSVSLVYVHEFIDIPYNPDEKENVKLLNDTLDIVHKADCIILSFDNDRDYENVVYISHIVGAGKNRNVTDNVYVFCCEFQNPVPCPELKAFAMYNKYTYCDSYYKLYIDILNDVQSLGVVQ